MPDSLTDWLTTLKDRATQLLIKFKTGALVTQQTIFRAVTALGRIWDFFSKPVITLKPFLLVFCSSHEPFGWSHYSSVGIFARLPLFWPLFGHPSINPNEKIRVTTSLSNFDTYIQNTSKPRLDKIEKMVIFHKTQRNRHFITIYIIIIILAKVRGDQFHTDWFALQLIKLVTRASQFSQHSGIPQFQTPSFISINSSRASFTVIFSWGTK